MLIYSAPTCTEELMNGLRDEELQCSVVNNATGHGFRRVSNDRIRFVGGSKWVSKLLVCKCVRINYTILIGTNTSETISREQWDM